MNEKIILKNGNEYPLVLGGTSSSPETLHMLLQTDDTLEHLITVFSNSTNTEQIRTINEDGRTLAVYDGYTVLRDPKATYDHYLISQEQYDEEGNVTTEAVYGRVALLKLSQPYVEAQVEQNRADIDFLAVMTGTNL